MKGSCSKPKGVVLRHCYSLEYRRLSLLILLLLSVIGDLEHLKGKKKVFNKNSAQKNHEILSAYVVLHQELKSDKKYLTDY